jgi:hypothetical protein
MAKCPLCESTLVGGECPVCSAGAAAERERDTDRQTGSRPAAERPEQPTDRVKAAQRPTEQDVPASQPPGKPAAKAGGSAEERAKWYALAGEERPPDLIPVHKEESHPIALSEREDEQRGFGAAAIIFIAQGVSGLMVIATGQPPAIADSVISIVVGFALLTGSSRARFLVLIGAAIHLGFCGLALLLVGHWLAVLSMVPSLCVFRAVYLDTPTQRNVATAVGVACAFSWFGFYAFRSDAKTDELKDYEVAQAFVDPEVGLSVKVPGGVTFYDAKKIVEAAKSQKAGLLGKILKEALSQRPGSERIIARGNDGTMRAVVQVGHVPPSVPMESVLTPIFGEESSPTRDDELVPRGIRESSALKAQGWRAEGREVVLVRTSDGRLVTAACSVLAAGGDRLCQALFAGLSVAPAAAAKPAVP